MAGPRAAWRPLVPDSWRRQTFLLFSLPRGVSLLGWKRRGLGFGPLPCQGRGGALGDSLSQPLLSRQTSLRSCLHFPQESVRLRLREPPLGGTPCWGGTWGPRTKLHFSLAEAKSDLCPVSPIPACLISSLERSLWPLSSFCFQRSSSGGLEMRGLESRFA